MSDRYLCTGCGQWHDELPFAYHGPPPTLESRDGPRRWIVENELCEHGAKHWFIHGRLVVPVLDADEDFTWGAWVSLSQASAERSQELWFTEGRESEPPFFGWVMTALPYEPTTMLLKAMVHTQPVGERPLIELEPTDHPLAVEQREGVTLERVREIASAILHPQPPG